MEEEVSVEELKAAIRKGVLARAPRLRGFRLQEQGRSGASRRCRRLPAQPARCRGRQGTDPETGEEDERPSSKGSLLRSGIQDHDRPVRRQAYLRPRILRPRRVRLLRGQRFQGQRERIGRILEMNATDRIDRDDLLAGDIVAVRRFQEHHHRRHPVRRGNADRPRVHAVR